MQELLDKPPVAGAPVPLELYHRLSQLNIAYGRCLDDNRLTEWPEFFTENCLYRIYPRENLEARLPASILFLDSKKMLRDRAICLSEVNIFNIHTCRRYISDVTASEDTDGSYSLRSNFQVYQTDIEGRTSLFSIGEYRDEVVAIGGELKFRKKIAIVDTFTISSQLSIPI